MKVKRGYFLGFEGFGFTQKEATQAAQDKAIRFVRDCRDSNPLFFEVGNWRCLVWRDADCWTYTLLSGSRTFYRGAIPQIMSQDEKATLQQTAIAALKHLASNAWTHEVEDDREFFRQAFAVNIVPGAVPLDIEAAVREQVRWAAWQRSYKTLNDAGLNKNDAHHAASTVADGYATVEQIVAEHAVKGSLERGPERVSGALASGA